MKTILTSGGRIIFVVLLATGWGWTTYLKDQGTINENQQFWVLVFMTSLLILEQIYSELPRPVNKSLIEIRRPIIERYLQGFLGQYYAYLNSHPMYKNKDVPAVKVNIMLPTRLLKLYSYLRIYYSACLEGIIYSEDEILLKWRRKHGTCGWAWKNCKSSPYDSARSGLQLPAKRMNEKQRDIVGNIKSALSIPIIYKGDVVGVMNLDSKDNISDTLFLDTTVYNLANACTNALRAEFYKDGVAA